MNATGRNALLVLILTSCGARSWEPVDDAAVSDGGTQAVDAGPERQPASNCDRFGDSVTVGIESGHYDRVGSTMNIRYGVFYCGPSTLEQSILTHVIDMARDGTETIVFEGRTTPGLPPGFQEFIEASVPDSDCLWIEVDPFDEVVNCGPAAPNCRLIPWAC